MSTQILLINVQYLKDNTPINGNVDSEVLEPFIIQAQDTRLERILGSDLLNKLKDDISGSTVSGVYKVLLDEYVQKTVAHWALYEALPYIQYKLTNKSVVTKDSDNSEAIELDELTYLRNGVRDTAEYYGVRITEYLCANSSSFPEYTDNNDADDIKPIDGDDNYFGGIIFD